MHEYGAPGDVLVTVRLQALGRGFFDRHEAEKAVEEAATEVGFQEWRGNGQIDFDGTGEQAKDNEIALEGNVEPILLMVQRQDLRGEERERRDGSGAFEEVKEPEARVLAGDVGLRANTGSVLLLIAGGRLFYVAIFGFVVIVVILFAGCNEQGCGFLSMSAAFNEASSRLYPRISTSLTHFSSFSDESQSGCVSSSFFVVAMVLEADTAQKNNHTSKDLRAVEDIPLCSRYLCIVISIQKVEPAQPARCILPPATGHRPPTMSSIAC